MPISPGKREQGQPATGTNSRHCAGLRTRVTPVLNDLPALLLLSSGEVGVCELNPQAEGRLLGLQDLQDFLLVVWKRVERNHNPQVRLIHGDDELGHSLGRHGYRTVSGRPLPSRVRDRAHGLTPKGSDAPAQTPGHDKPSRVGRSEPARCGSRLALCQFARRARWAERVFFQEP